VALWELSIDSSLLQWQDQLLFSAVVALTLTPVLCAMILKNNHGKVRKRRSPVRMFIDWFNRRFDKLTGRYTRILEMIITRRLVTFLVLVDSVLGSILSMTNYLPDSSRMKTREQFMPLYRHLLEQHWSEPIKFQKNYK
jgi:predicted RND superfamily exporter protein